MLKKIVIGFGLLVLIAISVIYGNYFFWKAVSEHFAVKNVNEQHAAAEIEADQILRSRISRLQQLGILGDQIAESKADTCYIESMGSFGGTWLQYCRLYYVAGYTALLSRTETYNRIVAGPLHKKDPNLPQLSERGECGWAASTENNAVYKMIYVLAGSIPANQWDDCQIPDLIGGIGPFGAGRPGNTKFDYTFDPDAINQSVDLLWITYTHRYYREILGCRPGPFCSALPRSTPIQAD